MLARLLALILIAGTGLAFGSAPAALATTPNVVLIMTDDQPENTMVAMRQTTNLLGGSNGTTFDNAVASFPLCCPSRASMLSGQFAHNHGVLGNGAFGGYAGFDDERSVQKALKDANYRTAYVGKYLNGYTGAAGVPDHWDDWHALAGSVDAAKYKLNDDGIVSQQFVGTDDANYQTDVLGRRAIGAIEEAESTADAQPFFLVFAPHAPHPDASWVKPTPSTTPDDPEFLAHADRHAQLYRGPNDPVLPEGPGFDARDPAKHPQIAALPALTEDQKTGLREEYRERLRALASVDEAVADLVAALAANGELDNTVIMYTTDNGWMQGEHRIPKGKIKVYEPSAGVPLLMRGPGVPQGHAVTTAVSNVDIGATILDAAGATPAAVIDGMSLLPLAQPSAYYVDRPVLLETATSAPLVPDGFSLVGDPIAKPFYAAVRTRRYLYVEYFELPDNGVTTVRHRELYDHQIDPEQTQNRAIQEDDCVSSPGLSTCVKGNDSRPYGPQQNRLQIALDKLRSCRGAAPAPAPGTCNVKVSIPHPS